jgi:hypothetical protein
VGAPNPITPFHRKISKFPKISPIPFIFHFISIKLNLI